MDRGRFDSLALAVLLALGAGAAGAAETGVPSAASAPVAASAPAAAASAPSPEFIALQARARTGDPAAEFELAKAIELGQGSGLPRDVKLALPWYGKAAAHRYAEAQSRLGVYYLVNNKHSEALHWFEQAAAQGHARAAHSLASMYDLGQGMARDGAKATELYKRAAELGWPESMWNLANIYGSGRYGETDMPQACVWALRAHTYADPNFPGVLKQYDKRLPLIEHKLGADGMVACRQQAEAWQPRQLPPEVRPMAAASAAH